MGLQPLPAEPAGPDHAGVRPGLGLAVPAAGPHLPLPLQPARRQHGTQGQGRLRVHTRQRGTHTSTSDPNVGRTDGRQARIATDCRKGNTQGPRQPCVVRGHMPYGTRTHTLKCPNAVIVGVWDAKSK